MPTKSATAMFERIWHFVAQFEQNFDKMTMQSGWAGPDPEWTNWPEGRRADLRENPLANLQVMLVKPMMFRLAFIYKKWYRDQIWLEETHDFTFDPEREEINNMWKECFKKYEDRLIFGRREASRKKKSRFEVVQNKLCGDKHLAYFIMNTGCSNSSQLEQFLYDLGMARLSPETRLANIQVHNLQSNEEIAAAREECKQAEKRFEASRRWSQRLQDGSDLNAKQKEAAAYYDCGQARRDLEISHLHRKDVKGPEGFIRDAVGMSLT